MFKFKNEKTWLEKTAYYNINGDIYRAEMRDNVDDKDRELPYKELSNIYGVWVCKYSLEYSDMADWNETHYCSLDEFFTLFNINESNEIDEKDLENAIKNLYEDFKKKFDEFELNDTLYTCNSYIHTAYNDKCCFQPIVKVKKKLINESQTNIACSLILEIEVLDGESATTKREFIKFHNFVENYIPGCNIKVVDSNDDNYTVDSYFE